MAYNEDSSASGHDEPWIQWFCGLKGHEMFCEVERSYIEDGFNLYGLRACVSNFSDCLDLILDRIGPDDSDDSHLTQSACTLYGLIHARYIITAHGLDAMYNKYAAKDFGICPLVQCGGQPVLPVGLSDEMGVDTVKIFCPKCSQVYHPPPALRSRGGSASGVDGAAFGTTFPHLFLMTFSNLAPDPLPPNSNYTPRVFGFRVHKQQQQQQQQTTTAAATARQRITTTATATAPAAAQKDNNKSNPGGENQEEKKQAQSKDAMKDVNESGGGAKSTQQQQPKETEEAGDNKEKQQQQQQGDNDDNISSSRKRNAESNNKNTSNKPAAEGNGTANPTSLLVETNPANKKRRRNNGNS